VVAACGVFVGGVSHIVVKASAIQLIYASIAFCQSLIEFRERAVIAVLTRVLKRSTRTSSDSMPLGNRICISGIGRAFNEMFTSDPTVARLIPGKILNFLVPQTPQTPFLTGRPFLKVVLVSFRVVVCSMHRRQYIVKAAVYYGDKAYQSGV